MLNVQKIREQFPALHQKYEQVTPIFFDGPGGSQVPQSVLDNIVNYLSGGNANLGGAYFTSKKTDAVMSEARLAAADLYNAASPSEVIFGANATSLAFSMSRAIANTWQAGDEIILTALDHYSNVSPWERVAAEKGVIVHHAPVNEDDCSLDEVALLKLVNDKTRLVAVTYASNTTGSIVDLGDLIAKIKANYKPLVYVDAVHLVPHCSVDVQALDCDFLVSSAYKYYGPHLGVLYAKKVQQENLVPYKVAPAKDINPNRWETGTQSFEALSGFTAAINYLASLSDNKDASRRKRLETSYGLIQQWENELGEYFLKQLADFENITLYGRDSSEGRTPTFAIRIEGLAPSDVSTFFAQQQVCIGDGNFYAQGLYEQLGLTELGGVIRIGLMHYNEKHEIDRFFMLLRECLSSHNLSS